jgi:hypothetical protein
MKTLRGRAFTFAIAIAFAFTLLSGCGSGSGSSSTGTTTTPTVPPTPSVLKAPIHGLVAMGQENFATNPAVTPDNSLAEPNANPNVYVASVILVTWKQLQPTSGSSLDTTAIDTALNYITAYNTAHPEHAMVGKLRIFAGVNAPVWAMNLDGSPLTGVSSSGTTVTLPRFWTANYIAAWTSLQAQLAAIYDKNSLLAEIAVSGCASTTAEPFIQENGTQFIPALKAAGYTDAQKMTCLSTMATQYVAWANTPLDYTFNAFTHVDTGVGVVDTAFPITVMTAWRSALGTARGIIANHGLQPTLTTAATPLYAEFTVLGPPLEFQTYGPTVDWPSTIAYGLTFKPSEIEIWTTTQAGGSAVISFSQLQAWEAEI